MLSRKTLLPASILTIVLFVVHIGSLFAQTPDPGIAGPHAVIKAEYNLGDLAFTPPAAAMFPSNMEVIGSVHYPADLSNGPYPVILNLHGRHSTCYDTTTMSVAGEGWPCTGTNKSIVSYEGYDYLARNMASHGYIVISISANAINAIDGGLSDAGMNARGVLVQHHLDLWNTWNTVGGFPSDSLLFVGALDMQNIGTMGHSRGGEGVVFNANYNISLGSPYGIHAVLTLAPVDFFRHKLNGTPLMNVAPYCDGDVSDLQGVHFYDDVRYNDTTDFAPKHNIEYMGADHDLFNTVWTPGGPIPGGVDDWSYYYSESATWCGDAAVGTGRFDSLQQQAALLPYYAAFYRTYLGHESQFTPILTVDDTVPPASSGLTSRQVYLAYHPSKLNRLDINRADSTNRITINTLQDVASDNGLTTYDVCNGGLSMASCGISGSQQMEPHKGNSGTAGLAQLNMQWTSAANYFENNIPQASENFSQYQDLIFRAAVNYHLYTGSADLDFTVQMTDSMGNTRSTVVSNWTQALFQQPGNQGGDLPKAVFNTIHVPISAFDGIDLTKVRQVKFLFNQSAAGAIVISDMALSAPVCSNLAAVFSTAVSTSYLATFTNNTYFATGDSLIWYWNFGDAASGVFDTSSAQNPTHTYPGPGTYYPCLKVMDFKKNWFTCQDSFCQTLVVTPPLALANPLDAKISIVPNPASMYLKIYGAEKGDLFELLNPMGQVVLAQTITDPTIVLPQALVAGIYYAVVNKGEGRVIRKVLISR